MVGANASSRNGLSPRYSSVVLSLVRITGIPLARPSSISSAGASSPFAITTQGRSNWNSVSSDWRRSAVERELRYEISVSPRIWSRCAANRVV